MSILGRAAEPAGGQAIAQVIAQQQFQRAAADLVDLVRLALDLHALGRRVAQAGTSRPLRPSLTRHTRQEVDGSQPSRKQSVGISMPSFRAASRTVAPGGTSTSRWSIVSLAWHVHSTTTASTGQTCRQVSQRVHFCQVDRVPGVGRHGDGVGRALLGAERAADALVGDAVGDQGLALARRAAARQVGLVLGAEVAERREHRVGRGAAQAADAAGADACAPVVRVAPGRPSAPLPAQMRSRMSSIRRVPMRQSVHLPHDWSWVKRRK